MLCSCFLVLFSDIITLTKRSTKITGIRIPWLCLCWWYIDTMQKLTFINESFGFFFEYLFKAWFFQLDLMAVAVTVDVLVVCFLNIFLRISFKVMIEKADLCLWPIRNPPWKVPVFLPFFEYLIKYDRQCSNYVDSGRNPLFLWKCGWKPLLFYFQYIF